MCSTLVAVALAACGSADDGREVSAGAGPLGAPGEAPELAFFEDAPAASDLALTFDDGPDPSGYTDAVLDTLRSKGVKATFFINTNNAIDVNASSAARQSVLRMVGEGHQVGNHSVSHADLAEASVDVWAELRGVQTTLRAFAPAALSQRLVRTPYGQPYLGPTSLRERVSPLVARHGVHVGWNVDSRDWECQSGSRTAASCVRDNVLAAIDEGRSGVVLLHSIHPATVDALPDLIDALRGRGKRFVTIEDLVVAKYGKPSRHLVHCASNDDCSPGDACGADRRCGSG